MSFFLNSVFTWFHLSENTGNPHIFPFFAAARNGRAVGGRAWGSANVPTEARSRILFLTFSTDIIGLKAAKNKEGEDSTIMLNRFTGSSKITSTILYLAQLIYLMLTQTTIVLSEASGCEAKPKSWSPIMGLLRLLPCHAWYIVQAGYNVYS